ncbi:riboflavin synthase [Vaginella massiliensis]|uniref:riboflavin synthase n=1 Tax=Vaginella massiliensis TaxID=1816680 RepID=UPI000837C490|nr:riboflavin synthase [Vaginella massiliensis]
MFTGIVENLGVVTKIEAEESNLHFWLSAEFDEELTIDQSIAHNGVCLTVVEINGNDYRVTAIQETLDKTNLGLLKVNDLVNLERCVRLSARLDGHIVQGHVDQTGKVKEIQELNGSHVLTISYDEELFGNVTVEKGSICLNGVSLTVVDSKVGEFSVAIIPYTWEFTNLSKLEIGDKVNLEFDIIGKYIKRLTQR